MYANSYVKKKEKNLIVAYHLLSDVAAIILPTLQHLHESMSSLNPEIGTAGQMRIQTKNKKNVDSNAEREDECGICLESSCTKMVLPGCCHAMCINCYRNWNLKSESCPFCRGSLKRVSSADLWVLTSEGDIIDERTLLKDDILRFYLYINSLCKDASDALFLVYYEYLI
ncbi:E3 ubiquitin-protein ligase AIRP2-like [Impatiens glandulifera]|uniref:E3 ubiquitin-protein ligase AIRP2-like n=1 Tax=Impatiens glandulifera TaxID=253017 RepID=UPI001FB07AA2|nr:E3 ubiquitin-protein ligase AIRP2-like [Impatiens glandulifera]